MLFGRNMTPHGYAVRMAICAAADLFDFTVGRALFITPGEEIPSTIFYTLMWGWAGLAHLLELADLTEQVDAFIPSAVLVGLWAGYDKGMWGRKKPATPPQPSAAARSR